MAAKSPPATTEPLLTQIFQMTSFPQLPDMGPSRKPSAPSRTTSDLKTTRSLFPISVPKDLTAQAVQDLRLVFATFQETDRAVISVSQLADIVELMGDPRPDISVLRSCLSALSNGNTSTTRILDFKKFLRFFVSHLHGGHLPVRSREIFKAFDYDGNAHVTAEELQESLTGMGMSLNLEEACAMTSVADGTCERAVDYAEFKQILKRIEQKIKHSPSFARTSIPSTMAMAKIIGTPDTTPQTAGASSTPKNQFMKLSPMNDKNKPFKE